MDAARNAVAEVTGHGGRERTDVEEVVNPAVTSEVIKPHVHEETQEAVDREVHQHHYHTTVQPLQAREVLPEQHVHQVAPQIEREFRHGDLEQERARVEADLGQFRDTRTVEGTSRSTGVASQALGEHYTHHVHEVVQPVIHKETIQPEVVHTVIPIHEKHIAPSEHHGISMLPTKTMDDFQGMKQVLTGGSTGHTEYAGSPRPYDHSMQPDPEDVDLHPERHEGNHDPEATGHFRHSHGHGTTTGAGIIGAGNGGLPGQGTSSREYESTSGTGIGSGTGTGIGSGYGSGAGVGSGVGIGSGAGIGSGSMGTGSSGYPTGAGNMGTSTSGYESGYRPQETSTTGGYSNPAAMGTGVAGVGAGAVAADLARDHRRAGQTTDLDPRDTQGIVGDSGANYTGTALGGRTEGNFMPGGSQSTSGYQQQQQPRDETYDSNRTRDIDPRDQQTSGTTEHHHRHHDTTGDDSVQHASRQGEDPGLETKTGKWTGTGEPGSHSAVFGLTPDGKTYNETQNHTTPLKTTPRDQEQNQESNDTSSRNTAAPGIADQLNDPRVAEKGHSGQAEYGGSSINKPGAGL